MLGGGLGLVESGQSAVVPLVETPGLEVRVMVVMVTVIMLMVTILLFRGTHRFKRNSFGEKNANTNWIHFETLNVHKDIDYGDDDNLLDRQVSLPNLAKHSFQGNLQAS